MTRWGKFGLTLCALALFGFVNTSNADITVEVFPAFAPVGPGSPNWSPYVPNAIAGINAGGVNTGMGPRDDHPSYYEVITGPISPSEIIFTEFNSWRGTADNNPAFLGNPAVQDEFGNRVHFGTRISASDGMEFSLSQVTWELDSDDLTDYFDQSGNFASAPYSDTRIGILYGADGVRGTADDVIINSGPGTQMVNELQYVGVGDGFPSENIAASTNQDDLDLTIAALLAGCVGDCEVSLIGTYTVGDASGSGEVVLFVPEPASIGLALFGALAGLAAFRKRR